MTGPKGWEHIYDDLWVRKDGKFQASRMRGKWAVFGSGPDKRRDVPKYDTIEQAADETDKAHPPEVAAQ